MVVVVVVAVVRNEFWRNILKCRGPIKCSPQAITPSASEFLRREFSERKADLKFNVEDNARRTIVVKPTSQDQLGATSHLYDAG